MKIAILDDYQDAALSMADWSAVERQAEITVFADHLADQDDLVARLEPFDVVCVMRERTPLPREVHRTTAPAEADRVDGPGNASIDYDAAADHDVVVTATPATTPTSTVELTWALIMGLARVISSRSAAVSPLRRLADPVGRELAGRSSASSASADIGNGRSPGSARPSGWTSSPGARTSTPPRPRGGRSELVSK